METTSSPSYRINLRIEIVNQVEMFGEITKTISETGEDIGVLDIVRVGKGTIIKDFMLNALDETHEKELVDAAKKIKGGHDYPCF